MFCVCGTVGRSMKSWKKKNNCCEILGSHRGQRDIFAHVDY